MMTTQLSPTEMQTAQDLLQDYEPAQSAIATLCHHHGNLDSSLEELVAAETSLPMDADADDEARESLTAVFLRNLRREICGDDGFIIQVERYNENPGQAVLLTGLIVYLIDLVTLPINPAIATVVVLWVLKLGLRTFCEYTELEKA